MKDAADLSAVEAARLIEDGGLSAEALAAACLDRIEVREPQIRAWAHIDRDRALSCARDLDAGGRRGALHGLPIAVKDIFDTADMPTGYGSALYDGHRPSADAAVVALAGRAGGYALGKTVTTEFAYFTAGPTRNPRDLARTPGGSSSGSAAAVAAGMAPLAFGTQTAGSVIRPAAFCGIVGYKPSFGLINTAGLKPFAWSLDTVGVFARTVADAALLAGAVADRDLSSGLGAVETPRVGLCHTPQWDAAEPAMAADFETAAACFKAAGAEVLDVELPSVFERLLEAQKTIMAYEGARALAHERLRHGEGLSAKLRELIDDGMAIEGEAYDHARTVTATCRARLDEAFGEFDVLLAPSAPGEAPLAEAGTGDPVFCRIWTLLGTPWVNVPGLTGPSGLPLGVQAIGRPLDDARTLAVAAWMADCLA